MSNGLLLSFSKDTNPDVASRSADVGEHGTQGGCLLRKGLGVAPSGAHTVPGSGLRGARLL